MKSILFWSWLGLFFAGIFLVTLISILAFSDCKNQHPKKKKYKVTEGQEMEQEDNFPEEESPACYAGLKCFERRKKKIDFDSESEVWQIISREVKQEGCETENAFQP